MPDRNLEGYGYDGGIEEIREKYYSSLSGNGGQVYLDHAGTTLYPRTLIEKFSENLLSSVYGNPHSKSPSSQLSERWIEKTRGQVLDMFNGDISEYSIIFTSNTTSAVKIIGEGLSSIDCNYIYLKDSHTSLVGLRNLTNYVVSDDIERSVMDLADGNEGSDVNSLISWPAQSNFSGKRYPSEDWIKRIKFVNEMNMSSGKGKKGKLYTLIDAAAISSTKPIDLSIVNADFVVVSFYKIFGFPDLGGLIVRNKVLAEFFANRRYFGGGTLTTLANETDFVARKSFVNGQSLEDGTLPFHNIIALSIAINEYRAIYGSFISISNHTSTLTGYLYQQLTNLKYKNGQKLVEIYGPSFDNYINPQLQGPIITFNLKDPNGNYIGYSDFESIASSQNISIRTGTLCNSGANSSSLDLTDVEIIDNYSKGHVCGDSNDIINNKPTGVIRVSLGACSNLNDITILINCLKDFYIKSYNNVLDKSHISKQDYLFSRVTSLTIYPIKSCSGYKITTPWKITQGGLQWDREFCLINRSNYSVITLKKYPEMVHIHPIIKSNSMIVNYYENEITIPLTQPINTTSTTLKVCGTNVLCELYTDPSIINFFTSALNTPCTLARIQNEYRMFKQQSTTTTIANSSPILLISQSSVNKLSIDSHKPIDYQVFRANIVISGNPAFSEDEWSTINISNTPFNLLGPCQRCNMICIDSDTGKLNQAPYKALHDTRKKNGKIYFGQHMTLHPDAPETIISIGDTIINYQ